MPDTRSSKSESNRLLSLSLQHPILMMLGLYVLAWLIKIVDVFVFRLDELVGEAILTKGLGLLLVAVYVWACGRRLSDIGFHTRFLGKTLLIACLSFTSVYIVAFAAQLIQLRAAGEEATLALWALDSRTGMSGGLGFAIWLLAANLVNAAMEEGLFRGTMIRHFLIRFSSWGAILLQAVLFALWHLNWPLRQLLDGTATPNEAAFVASGLLLSTMIAAIIYGYFYSKTDNLWGAFFSHALNNSIFNVLFIKTSAGMQSGLELGLFLAIFLGGHLLLLPVIRYAAARWQMPQVRPWGEFADEPQPLAGSIAY